LGLRIHYIRKEVLDFGYSHLVYIEFQTTCLV
jgi:hypothetical protein